MLHSLFIRNFALIERLELSFQEGLHVISGETGSGKSIVIHALEFLLGEKMLVDFIREGEEEAEVVGVFGPLKEGAEEVVLRRVLSRQGRSKAYENDRPVTLTRLEEVGNRWVDIAAQHAQQVLLHSPSHVDLLDEYGELSSEVQNFEAQYREMQKLREEKDSLKSKQTTLRDKEDFLRFQLKEILDINPVAGEESLLSQEKELCQHGHKIAEVCQKVEDSLMSGELPIQDILIQLSRETGGLKTLDPEFEKISESFENVLGTLQEIVKKTRKVGDRLSFDPERFQFLEDRLGRLSKLKRKYGGDIEAVLLKKEEIEKDLDLLDHFESAQALLEKQFVEKEAALLRQAQELKQKRNKVGEKLSKDIEKELKNLGMPLARFFVQAQDESLTSKGVSLPEFFFEPNPGEGAKPLPKIASGGEVSRIFLAIKKAMVRKKSLGMAVFDEVDTGIGGAVADAVGKTLKSLAEKKQVLCITHLPQVAAYGEHHFVIQKRVEKGRTMTELKVLSIKEREEELARMLSGQEITSEARRHARDMLKRAEA